jgi:hypothetical protein
MAIYHLYRRLGNGCPVERLPNFEIQSIPSLPPTLNPSCRTFAKFLVGCAVSLMNPIPPEQFDEKAERNREGALDFQA